MNSWISTKYPPDLYQKVLILLLDKSVRYGYYGIKGWWIYSCNNGFITTLERNVIGWKNLQ